MEKTIDYALAEKQIQELWEREKIFDTKKGSGPLFSVDTPPPTVSGKLHIGHIFSYTHADIVVRYMRLCGYSVFYPLGFDDNGLPTERFVELRREVSPHQMSRADFVAVCREEVAQAEEEFKQLWQRLGLSVDWNKTYSTVSEWTQKLSQESFLLLLKRGLVYRKEEPALYCPIFRTAVSQADLEDVEKETLFSDIEFKSEEGESLVISTTRPELLPSCVALFYHPGDTRYQHLSGKKAIVPLFEQVVPILADEKVQIEKGSGLVMCCTFGDKTDVEWFKKHHLPYRPSIGLDGRMLESTGPLSGKKVAEARLEVLGLLKQKDLVKQQRTIRHSVSVFERSKREVEFLMLSQWFVKILPFKQELLAMADEITWHPAFMKARFIDWVENLQWDWCISRQRFAGIPFPIWYDKKTGELYVPELKNLPLDPRTDQYPGDVPAGVELIPDTDVMDTWNTSSISPYLCRALYENKTEGVFEGEVRIDGFIPMGMRPHAHDIIRTWTFYTMVKTLMHSNARPWDSLVISGHVLSPEGSKISKSKGNNPLEPDRLLSTYPADVVRYWTASATLGQDVAFSENTLKIGNKLVNKLWNACRFAQEHFVNVPTQEPDKKGELNEWLLHKISSVYKQYVDYFERREFSLALGVVEQFFWGDFCDNYLELIKYRFYKPELFESSEVAATRWTLYHATLRLIQLFAPFLPFITEKIYQELFKNNVEVSSVHITEFKMTQKMFVFEHSEIKIKALLAFVDEIRKLKSEKKLSLKTEVNECVIVASQDNLDFLKTQEATLKGISGVRVFLYMNKGDDISFIEERDGSWNATVCLL